MGQTQKEQAQIEVIINGQKATATIADMEKAIKVLNQQIKGLTPGTDEFIKKTEELQKVKGKLNDVKSSVSGVKDETKKMVDQMQEMGPVGSLLQKIRSGFGEVVSMGGNAVKMFTTLSGALTGLGLGAILILFSSLVSYFKNTEEGGDRLAKIMRVVGAVFSEVMKVLGQIGGVLFDAGQAMVDFISGTDDAKKTTDDYKKSVVELAAEVADLEDAISILTVSIDLQNDKLQTGIETNLKALKNRNITLAESQKLIGKIGDLEEQKLKNSNSLLELKIQKERKEFLLKTQDFGADSDKIKELQKLEKLALEDNNKFQLDLARNSLKEFDDIIKKNEQKGLLFDKFIKGEMKAEELLDKAKGTYTEEDVKRVAEILMAKEAAFRESENLSEKLNNLEDAAANKEEARQQKAEEERKRRAEKKRKDEEEEAKRQEDIRRNILKLEMDALDESLDNKKKKLQMQAEEEKRNVKGNEEQKAIQIELIDKKLKNDLKKIQDDFDKEKNKKEEEAAKAREESLKKEYEAKKANDLASADLEIMIAQETEGDILQAKLNRLELDRKYELDNTNLTSKQKLLINMQYDQKREQMEEEARKQKTAKDKQTADTAAGYLNDAAREGFNFAKIANDKQIRDAERLKNARLEKLDEELKTGRITQELYDKKKEEAEKESDKQTRAIKNKQAKQDKAANITQGIMSIPLAIIKALPNIPLAIATGVMGGLNLAKIIATPAAEYKFGGIFKTFKSMFNNGGIVRGSRHGSRYGSGGIALVDRLTGIEHGEMEGNEIILTSGVTNNPRLRQEASRLNVAGGGRSFALGGSIGSDATSIASTASNSAAQSQDIVTALNNINNTLATMEVKAKVVYNDIEDAANTKNEIVQETKLAS